MRQRPVLPQLNSQVVKLPIMNLCLKYTSLSSQSAVSAEYEGAQLWALTLSTQSSGRLWGHPAGRLQ